MLFLFLTRLQSKEVNAEEPLKPVAHPVGDLLSPLMLLPNTTSSPASMLFSWQAQALRPKENKLALIVKIVP